MNSPDDAKTDVPSQAGGPRVDVESIVALVQTELFPDDLHILSADEQVRVKENVRVYRAWQRTYSEARSFLASECGAITEQQSPRGVRVGFHSALVLWWSLASLCAAWAVLEWLLLLLTNTMIRQHALALILASIGTGAVVMLIGFSGLLSNRRQRDRSGSSSSRPLSHLCAGLVLGCAVGALALVTAVAVRNRWSDGGVHSANLIMYSGWTIFFAAILLFGWSGLHARGNLADRLFGPGLSSTRARDLMIWSLLCWLPEILFLAFFAPRAPTAIETYTQQTDFWFVLLGIPLLLPALGWCDARLRREQRHALWMRIAVTACACVALGLAIGVQSKWVPQWRLYALYWCSLVFAGTITLTISGELLSAAVEKVRNGRQMSRTTRSRIFILLALLLVASVLIPGCFSRSTTSWYVVGTTRPSIQWGIVITLCTSWVQGLAVLCRWQWEALCGWRSKSLATALLLISLPCAGCARLDEAVEQTVEPLRLSLGRQRVKSDYFSEKIEDGERELKGLERQQKDMHTQLSGLQKQIDEHKRILRTAGTDLQGRLDGWNEAGRLRTDAMIASIPRVSSTCNQLDGRVDGHRRMLAELAEQRQGILKEIQAGEVQLARMEACAADLRENGRESKFAALKSGLFRRAR